CVRFPVRGHSGRRRTGRRGRRKRLPPIPVPGCPAWTGCCSSPVPRRCRRLGGGACRCHGFDLQRTAEGDDRRLQFADLVPPLAVQRLHGFLVLEVDFLHLLAQGRNGCLQLLNFVASGRNGLVQFLFLLELEGFHLVAQRLHGVLQLGDLVVAGGALL